MPELPTTAVRSGLFTVQDVPVPLTGVAIDAEISSFCGRVSVSQRFVNREASPIEAVYVFPLEDGAAVCGFEAIIDGTLVVGEVKEREEAFRMYDDAMEGGHGAYLLDEERPDVFRASVGNLPPGSEVLLKLTYVTELTVEGNGLRFAIPTTVSPRYAPPEDHTGVGQPDARTLNPPVAWRVPYGLDLSIRLTMTGPIARVESTSHPVSVSIDGQEATVTLSQRAAALDRDFVLSVEAEGLDAPQAWIERGDDGADAIAVGFVPKFSEASTPAEVIFLVDRSGSMQGTSIEEVRNALQLCLRSMIAGCRFNIIGFGSSYVALFEESQLYAEQSLSEASAHVSALTANLGGTELLPALEFALTQKHAGGLVRQVVILTDGQITNTDAALNLARKHAAGARIFTFGIGTGASPHLVRGLARAGGGTAEFIYPGERIEPKVVRQLGRLLSPSLTDVRMDWGGLDVTQAPSHGSAGLRGRTASRIRAGEARGRNCGTSGRRVDGGFPLRADRFRGSRRSVARDLWPVGRGACRPCAHPGARGEPRVDRCPWLAAGPQKDDRCDTGNHRPRRQVRADVARNVVRGDRAAREARRWGCAASACTDRPHCRVGRLDRRRHPQGRDSPRGTHDIGRPAVQGAIARDAG